MTNRTAAEAIADTHGVSRLIDMAADGAHLEPRDYEVIQDLLSDLTDHLRRTIHQRDCAVAACEWVDQAFVATPHLTGAVPSNIRDVRQEVQAALGSCLPAVRTALREVRP